MDNSSQSKIGYVKPNQSNDLNKKAQVEEMFDDISSKYDFLNRSLSMGIDKIWRKRAIKILGKDQPKSILDVATGTADVIIAAQELRPEETVGVDISAGMLEIGREKLNKLGLNDIKLIKADSENLPFEDNSFDASIVSFGVRNFENVLKGLSEINRVINSHGRLVVLEFSKPTGFPFKQLFNFYFRYILPLFGKLVSKSNNAYTYLPESVKAFPQGDEFLAIMRDAGFIQLEMKRLTFGVCTIYSGIKSH